MGLPPPSRSSSSSSSQPARSLKEPPAGSSLLPQTAIGFSSLRGHRAARQGLGTGDPGLRGPQRWAGARLCPLRWGKHKGLLLLLGEFQRVAEDLESRLLIIESTCLGRFTADTEHRLAPGGGKRHKGIKVPGTGTGPPHAACTAVPGHWGRSRRMRHRVGPGDAGVWGHDKRRWHPAQHGARAPEGHAGIMQGSHPQRATVAPGRHHTSLPKSSPKNQEPGGQGPRQHQASSQPGGAG